MILLSHPFGNANVRAVLDALERADLLAEFVTALGWTRDAQWLQFAPAGVRAKLMRRAYSVPNERLRVHPAREIVRLLAGSMAIGNALIEHERGWASIDSVWQELDREAAGRVRRSQPHVTGVYAYEDCALETFRVAHELGIRRIYDLPIAYFETSQRLLREEAERYPDWEPTLVGTRDSAGKLARKTQELELAELVICPSAFVLESLPVAARSSKTCVVIPFGSPPTQPRSRAPSTGRLRVLFAGAMTQRKGLADLFAAMQLLKREDVELVVMGSPLQPLAWYRARGQFAHESPRPHAQVLELMRSCDVFVLPSIVEGRALVQQEAMACGLPLIATKNAGGDDLIVDGETGFLVPIRSP